MQAAAVRGGASMMPVEANLLSRFGRVVRAYTFFYSDSAGVPLLSALALAAACPWKLHAALNTASCPMHCCPCGSSTGGHEV